MSVLSLIQTLLHIPSFYIWLSASDLVKTIVFIRGSLSYRTCAKVNTLATGERTALCHTQDKLMNYSFINGYLAKNTLWHTICFEYVFPHIEHDAVLFKGNDCEFGKELSLG